MATGTKSRAALYQGVYLGWEATSGVVVPSTRRLIGMVMNQMPIIPIKTVKEQGTKGASGTQRGQQYTEAKVSGAIDFNNFAYLHTLAWGASDLSSDENTNVAYTRFWNPSSLNPANAPVTATMLQGSVAGAEKMGYAFMPDFSIKWGKEEATFDGMLIGQIQDRDASITPNIKITVSAPAIATAIALDVTTDSDSGTIPNGTYYTNLGKPFVVTGGNAITAGAATLTVNALVDAIGANEYTWTVPEVVSVPADFDLFGVYISLDGAAYTRLLDTLDGGITCNGLWKPSFHVNDNPGSASFKTFDRIVECQPDITATLTTEEGTEADNWMTHLENGDKVWLGVKVTGPVIDTDGATNYLWRINIPFYVTKPDPGDKGEVYGNTFTFELAHDPAFGMFQVTLVNQLPSL